MTHDMAERVFDNVWPTAKRTAESQGLQFNSAELRTEVFEIVVDNPEVTSIGRGREIILDALGLEG